MPNSPIKTLWIDDHIDNMMPFVSKLEREGFSVQTASSVEEAIIFASKVNYDLLIVDIRMEPLDGIYFLQQVDALQPNAGRVLLTSFSYLQKYRDRIAALDFNTGLVEKPLPNFESVKFITKVVRKLKEHAGSGRKAKTEEAIKPTPGHEINPFAISFNDFMELTISQKDQITDLALKQANKTIVNAFSKGSAWVLLCGSKDQIRMAVDDPRNIPPEHEILKVAEGLDCAPYQVFQSIVPEDMWTPCKPGEHQLNDYPTITLRVKSNKLTSHFDTGSPITFFSYEDLLDMRGMDPASTFIRAMRSGSDKVYRFAQMECNCKVICQLNGETKSIVLKGQAVRNWPDSPFIRHCDTVCDNKKSIGNTDTICKHRHALIGRNVLTDNGLKLVLDGNSKKTILGDK